MKKIFSVLMIIIVVLAMFMAGIETYNNVHETKWEPSVVYEFVNKHINWG